MQFPKLFSVISLLGLVSLLSALSGCERSPANPDLTSIAGVYTLRTIDSSALPVSITTGAGKSARVISGTLELQRNGGYLQVLHYSLGDGASAVHESGRYTTSQEQLRFDSNDRDPYVGSIAEERLVIDFDLADASPQSERLVFTRE